MKMRLMKVPYTVFVWSAAAASLKAAVARDQGTASGAASVVQSNAADDDFSFGTDADADISVDGEDISDGGDVAMQWVQLEEVPHLQSQENEPPKQVNVEEVPVMVDSTRASDGDGNADFIKLRDRMASSEQENMRLRKLLRQAQKFHSKLWAKIGNLTLNLRRMSAIKSREENQEKVEKEQVKGEKEQVRDLQSQLRNASSVADTEAKALLDAQSNSNLLREQISKMSSFARNKADAYTALQEQLVENNRSYAAGEKSLRYDIAKLKQQLVSAKEDATKTLESKTRELTSRLTAMEIQELAERKQADRVPELENNISGMQRQLATERERTRGLKEFAHMLDLRVKQSKEAMLARKVQRLQRAVILLRERAAHGDRGRQQAEEVAMRLKVELEKAKTEIVHFRSSEPWLEKKTVAEEKEMERAVAKAKDAEKQRDVAKAMLDEARRRMKDLERKYVGVVQELGKTYAQPDSGVPAAGSSSIVEDPEVMAAALLIGDEDDDDDDAAASSQQSGGGEQGLGSVQLRSSTGSASLRGSTVAAVVPAPQPTDGDSAAAPAVSVAIKGSS
eukprot:TRINITY_DN62341_c0_g1_i1.p1 TRINITY_DN62341_c0_g1~~TRINITY_DN62341_c0_g1_i1.p1  ORF type:complete len:565 (+),score=153.80 TRINITY_DN62341_c0_g1_i1:175-1869(+)